MQQKDGARPLGIMVMIPGSVVDGGQWKRLEHDIIRRFSGHDYVHYNPQAQRLDPDQRPAPGAEHGGISLFTLSAPDDQPQPAAGGEAATVPAAIPIAMPQLELFACPAFLIDGDACVMARNGHAGSLLKQTTDFTLSGRKLRLRDSRDSRRLAHCLARAREEAFGGKNQEWRFAVAHGDGECPHVMSIRTLPQAQTYGHGHGHGHGHGSQADRVPVALLLVSGPRDADARTILALCEFFGLTRAETALCRHLAGGDRLAAAATAINIAESTARQRLKAIFRKTDTCTQAGLIRLLMSYGAVQAAD